MSEGALVNLELRPIGTIRSPFVEPAGTPIQPVYADGTEGTVEVFEPFEAYLSEFTNEENLRWFERQQACPGFKRPAIIRGFHYMDEEFAKSVGGTEYCLKAPAWRVERFCDGVLIELTEALFDNDNSEHLAVQRKVMEYFGIWEFDQPAKT